MKFREMILEWDVPIYKQPIGAVVMLATDLPDNMLNCDGTQYNRVDYPDLYAALDTVFHVDADHFKTPDMRSRSPIGIGQGTGLARNYTMGQQYGNETVTLALDQIPSHEHGERVWDNAPAFIWNGSSGTNMPIVQSASKTANTARLKTDSAGGGNYHENIHPVEGLRFGIVYR